MKRFFWSCFWVLAVGWLMYEAALLWPSSGRFATIVIDSEVMIFDTATGRYRAATSPTPPSPEKEILPSIPGPVDSPCTEPCPNQPKAF